jgi:ureidoacrylate peracid hydrolase
MHLDAGRTALIVVDMQNAFCHPEGSLARMGRPIGMCRWAVEPCRRLVEAARAGGVPVIFTRYVFRPDYADGGVLVNEVRPGLRRAGALRAGTWDVEIVDELRPEAGDVVVDKNRYSAFHGTNLESILTSLDVRSLVVGGVTTNMCVEGTVRDAAQRDYRVFVVREATGELDPARHEHALDAIGFGFGWVVGLDGALAALEAAGAGRMDADTRRDALPP